MKLSPWFPTKRILYPFMLIVVVPRLSTSIQDTTPVETSLTLRPDCAQRHAGRRKAASAGNDLVIMSASNLRKREREREKTSRIVPDAKVEKKRGSSLE